MSELESVFVQTQNEWKEALYQWNGANQELALEKELLRELSIFAETYKESSDFAEVRQRIADVWIKKNGEIESELSVNDTESQNTKKELEEVRADLAEWENQKEPQPERSEAVIRNRKRLDALGIPYQEFYKVIEFGDNLEEEACNRLEEALLKMGILDALVIDEQYKEQVLKTEQGCEDHYLFICKNSQKNLQPDRSLLDVLELNEEVNDIFSNQRLTGILGSIAYDSESLFTVAEDGTYGCLLYTSVLDIPENIMDQIRLVSTYKGVHVPSMMFDSTGTKKIAAIASYVIEALEQGRILVVDELDSSIHFKLTRAIVAMFNNELNTSAQMIFTVHDINLMDCKRMFRKEQIWFVHKDEEGVFVYSLADFTAQQGVRLSLIHIFMFVYYHMYRTCQ